MRYTGYPDRASVDRTIEVVAEERRSRGRRPYALPRGGTGRLGVPRYVFAAHELGQCETLAISPRAVVLATGSCGTQAGLVAGCSLLGLRWRIEAFTVSREAKAAWTRVLTLARAAGAMRVGLRSGRHNAL